MNSPSGNGNEEKGEDNLQGMLSAAGAEDAKEENRQGSGVQAMPRGLADRQKAGAMLDNVKENPARMLMFQNGKGRGGKREKAW